MNKKLIITFGISLLFLIVINATTNAFSFLYPSGPFTSEKAILNNISSNIGTACKCGQIRHNHFSRGIEGSYSGCEKQDAFAQRFLKRYEATEEKYKTKIVRAEKYKIEMCWVAD